MYFIYFGANIVSIVNLDIVEPGTTIVTEYNTASIVPAMRVYTFDCESIV